MPDWLNIWLAQIQGGIMNTLAAELRAGGIATAWLAFTLGALHALTPGHGKAALAAYMLGHDSRIGKGLRIALTAALLHVLSGLLVFLVIRFVIGKSPLLFGRPSPSFTAVGYGLIVLAGLIMLVQSLRSSRGQHGDGGHALTAGIGLLPCPLTISVLGFAWSQSSMAMVALVLVSLGLGISLDHRTGCTCRRSCTSRIGCSACFTFAGARSLVAHYSGNGRGTDHGNRNLHDRSVALLNRFCGAFVAQGGKEDSVM